MHNEIWKFELGNIAKMRKKNLRAGSFAGYSPVMAGHPHQNTAANERLRSSKQNTNTSGGSSGDSTLD